MLSKLISARDFLVAILFITTTTVSARKREDITRPLSLATPACTPTHPTYALITPSPNATPVPVTSIGQIITSLVPQYAVCNEDSFECTTIYSTKTWTYCSTTIPCYNQPASHGWCTVTDCADTVTFSQDNSYVLLSSPTLAILPVVTNYVLPYSDYVSQHHTAIHVEHCIEGGCKTHSESWERNVHTTYEQSAFPVTMQTYYPSSTVVAYAGNTHIITVPTTITYVTSSMGNFTHEIAKVTTVKYESTQSVPAYPTPALPTRVPHTSKIHYKTTPASSPQYIDKHTKHSHYPTTPYLSADILENSVHKPKQTPTYTPKYESVHSSTTKAFKSHTPIAPVYHPIASSNKQVPSSSEYKFYKAPTTPLKDVYTHTPKQHYSAPPPAYHQEVVNTTSTGKSVPIYSTPTSMIYHSKPVYTPVPKPYHAVPSYKKEVPTSSHVSTSKYSVLPPLKKPEYKKVTVPSNRTMPVYIPSISTKHTSHHTPKTPPYHKPVSTSKYQVPPAPAYHVNSTYSTPIVVSTSSQYHTYYSSVNTAVTYSTQAAYSAQPTKHYATSAGIVYSSYSPASAASSSAVYSKNATYSSSSIYSASNSYSPAYIKPSSTASVSYSASSYTASSYITPSSYSASTPSYSTPSSSYSASTPSYSTTSYSTPSYSTTSYSTPSYPPYSSSYTSSYNSPSYAKPTISVGYYVAPPPPPAYDAANYKQKTKSKSKDTHEASQAWGDDSPETTQTWSKEGESSSTSSAAETPRPNEQPENSHEQKEDLTINGLPPANNEFVEELREERNRAAMSGGNL